MWNSRDKNYTACKKTDLQESLTREKIVVAMPLVDTRNVLPYLHIELGLIKFFSKLEIVKKKAFKCWTKFLDWMLQRLRKVLLLGPKIKQFEKILRLTEFWRGIKRKLRKLQIYEFINSYVKQRNNNYI